MYRRYRDDISILSEAGEYELKGFLEKIDPDTRDIKIYMEISNQELNLNNI
jgi:hypothetical protein